MVNGTSLPELTEATLIRRAALFEDSHDAIVAEDLEGTVIDWNQGATEILGYSAGEMIGRSMESLIPIDQREMEAAAGERIRQGQRGEPIESRRQTRDGRILSVSVTASPIRDRAGNLIGIAKIARDITAQKQRESELSRLAEAAGEERRFSNTMIESMPGILYFYDEKGRFLRWNKNFETLTGYTGAEIAELSPGDFFSKADQSSLRARIAEVFDQGDSYIELPLRAKDGTVKPYFFTGKRVEFNGTPCLVGMGIDITERKQAEQQLRTSEDRYRTLFEYAPDGIVIADAGARYVDANSSACRMLGYARTELIGLHSSQIVVPEEISHIPTALNEIQTHADYHREWHFRRKDGSIFPAEVIATVMPDGKILAMIRDITERKQSEQALRRMNENLEQEVATRTRDLQSALIRAEAADQLKSAFLATMSHELRTPLNSIIGFTGILLQGLAGPLNAEQSKQLGMVKRSARHLLELINDVLDLSKIEAGQLEVRAESFDLSESLQLVMEGVKPLAEKKNLQLVLTSPPDVGRMISDRRRVEQLLLNLVNNAIKFTEHGRVTLTADRLPAYVSPAGSAPVPALRLRVTDTGIGIKPDDLTTLFQPFRQLDTGIARQHEGTGLGLAICRRLTALLGGEISVASEWAKGSEFSVILPFEKPTSQ